MPRTEAAVRARSGQVTNSVVTLERPDTWVQGPDGERFKLPPRSGGGIPTLQNQKVNGLTKDPATGKRRKRGSKQRGPAALLASAAPSLPGLPGMMQGKKGGISFSALAIGAFIGWRVFQVVRQRLRSKQQPPPQQAQQQQQGGPHAPIIAAMLRHVLPRLGPPSRVKRLVQQHHSKPRRAPSARQKMAPGTGVRQRRQGLLEKLDGAMKRQKLAPGTGVQQRRQGWLEKLDGAMKRQAFAQAAQQAYIGGQPSARHHLGSQDGALPLPSVQPMLMLAEADPPEQAEAAAEAEEPAHKHQQAVHRD